VLLLGHCCVFLLLLFLRFFLCFFFFFFFFSFCLFSLSNIILPPYPPCPPLTEFQAAGVGPPLFSPFPHPPPFRFCVFFFFFFFNAYQFKSFIKDNLLTYLSTKIIIVKIKFRSSTVNQSLVARLYHFIFYTLKFN